MLNIISRSIVSTHTRGPRKVALNLIKGLEEIGYPYVVNAALSATDTIWIHDDKEALEAALKLPGAPAIIAGPNIYTVPRDIPDQALGKNIVFLQPAPWVLSFWNTFGAQSIANVVWPVGIDTNVFRPSGAAVKDLVLIYNKQRSKEDVAVVTKALEARGERYKVLTYGQYLEAEYQHLLAEAKALVWIGRSESQGIGLLEALAMDVPVLVWDVTRLGDFVGAEKSGFTSAQLDFSPVTAAPYFDERCGLRFTDEAELPSLLDRFLSSLSTFTPRVYVTEELGLGKQAQALIDLYKTHFSITEAELRSKAVRTQKHWKNVGFFFTVRTRLKDAMRAIIR